MVKKVFFVFLLLLMSLISTDVYARSASSLQLKDSAITNGVALIVLGITIIVISIRMRINRVN